MAEESGQRVKVTLRWVQILDNLEPFYKERGEFRFTSRVSSDNRGGIVQESKFPEKGHYLISDHPSWNKLNLDKVVFEGEIDDHLVVEFKGEEIDFTSANDMLDDYRREFSGPPDSWIGEYRPMDEAEGADDPEQLSNWRLCYRIEKAG